MVLSELAALESAYQVLQSLDPAGRRRALQWLSDALGAEAPLGVTAEAPAADGTATARPARRRAKAAPAPAKRGRQTPRASSASETRSTRRRAEPAPAEGQGRAYRRMPPAEEVMAAYEQVGSVSGLADHFSVPRHTAQGWARQLRRHGYSIGRSR
jgi:hypothetical protein